MFNLILHTCLKDVFYDLQELWCNPEQFPRSFFKGSWEGFWWAFVSMTTVGQVYCNSEYERPLQVEVLGTCLEQAVDNL